MATIRRAGFGTVFELEDSKVGIGTDAATHTLQALGNIRSEAATDIGISSLTTYQGFVDKEARFTTGKIDNQSQSGSTSGEIVIDGDVTVSSATTFTSGPQHLTVTDTFTLPSGDTNSREEKPTPGSLRFNQDFATLEFYTGNNWATVNTFTDIKTNPQGSGRAVLFGGTGSSVTKSLIEFFNIATLGNSLNFGSLTAEKNSGGSCSNSIRGLSVGGSVSPSKVNTIEYITIQSEGDAIDFGDQSVTRTQAGGFASSTRGISAGGSEPAYSNVIDYVEIMTLGNALDFGDLSVLNSCGGGNGCSNPIRGVIGGALTNPSSPVTTGIIDSVIISSKGNAVDSGELTFSRRNTSASSNSVRGVFGGGDDTYTDTIDYVTLASLGNAIDFGKLSTVRTNGAGAANHRRATFCGGAPVYPAGVNIIEFVEIATTGDAQDFGDLVQPRRSIAAVSDSHGGLGGY